MIAIIGHNFVAYGGYTSDKKDDGDNDGGTRDGEGNGESKSNSI